ncbi:MAG: N-acetylglucosamine-6-phosphate deacetylase [Clostridia bacterium]|nr:N-acetylglucosamine-6-phosphate deacetylase [Clostridia bacterium]
MLTIVNALVYRTEQRKFVPGTVTVEDGWIVKTDSQDERGEVVNAGGQYLVPGLVDAHTHGRISFDFDSATTDQMIQMRKSYAMDGTTTLFPTIASAPFSQILTAIDRVKEAGFEGIHLEGRYLSEKRRGAHATHLLHPLDVEELEILLDRMQPLTVHLTCAPEMDNGEAFVRKAIERGATVSLGHSDAGYDEAIRAFEWGVTATTHTFNALAPIHHRSPGSVTAAFLTDSVYCEIIADGFHLHPAIVSLTYRSKQPDHLVLITDSMSATGCEDGEYSIAGEKVFVRNGKAVNVEGAIAGSTITLYTAVRNLMRFAGISFEQAIPCATILPARMLHIDRKVGSISVGKHADLLLIDPENYEIRGIWQAGERIR